MGCLGHSSSSPCCFKKVTVAGTTPSIANDTVDQGWGSLRWLLFMTIVCAIFVGMLYGVGYFVCFSHFNIGSNCTNTDMDMNVDADTSAGPRHTSGVIMFSNGCEHEQHKQNPEIQHIHFRTDFFLLEISFLVYFILEMFVVCVLENVAIEKRRAGLQLFAFICHTGHVAVNMSWFVMMGSWMRGALVAAPCAHLHRAMLLLSLLILTLVSVGLLIYSIHSLFHPPGPGSAGSSMQRTVRESRSFETYDHATFQRASSIHRKFVNMSRETQV